VRAITGLLARFGTRRVAQHTEPPAPLSAGEAGGVFPTKAFRAFLACLGRVDRPVLMDLGPVVGPNVAFFGERLGCKIFVEDLYRDLDHFDRQGRLAALPEFLRTRFPQPAASIDGILCWDVMDYLDRPAARVLAGELTRLLAPGGALLGFFGTVEEGGRPSFARFSVVDELHLRYRLYPASRTKGPALLTRDIIKMFDGLLVAESFLLKINTREMLFRKPPATASGP
jgi:hypothetical protein